MQTYKLSFDIANVAIFKEINSFIIGIHLGSIKHDRSRQLSLVITNVANGKGEVLLFFLTCGFNYLNYQFNIFYVIQLAYLGHQNFIVLYNFIL